METVVYRQHKATQVTTGPGTSGGRSEVGASGRLGAAQEAGAWQPGLFYSRLSEQELDVWAHWLPTVAVYPCDSGALPSGITDMLTRLHAPPKVLEEYRWSCTMELFDAYEIRTPQRRDLRDPLLLGRRGRERYGIALWGESLRPWEEITALVQESLSIRQRAARRRTWSMIGGTLGGLLFGLGIGSWSGYGGDPVATGLVCALVGLFFAWTIAQVSPPEQQQHDFLDRYRG